MAQNIGFYEGGMAVTPNDGTDIPSTGGGAFTGLTCTGAGTIKVNITSASGVVSTVTMTIAVGIVLPVRVTRVWATGTSATGIVALY